MPARFLPAAFATLLAVTAFALDPIDRRSRDEPEIAVRTGGRSGTCDAVRFTPDGRWLLAAGDDKVVTGWPHAADGLDTDPNHKKELHWPAWREQRGGIKDFAVSPDGKRVLVGGYGLRVASVAVLELEPEGGVPKMALTWPKTRTGLDSFRTVQTVAFAADGQRVAFATEDGSVWVWEPTRREKADEVGRWYNPPRWVGRNNPKEETLPADKPNARGADAEYPSRRVFFRKGGAELVSVSRAGDVWAFDVADPSKLDEVRDTKPAARKKLFGVNDGLKDGRAVFQAVYDARTDRLVVAGQNDPRVIVRPLDGTDPVVLPLAKETFARSVAIHPASGAVAVAVGTVVPAAKGQPQFHNDADDEIRVYRQPKAGAAPDLTIPMVGQGQALTFHPTDDRLAVAGGDADEVSVYDLKDAKKPLSVARGSGRKGWAVALAKGGRWLGLQTKRDAKQDRPNGRGAGEWAWLDLERIKPVDGEPKEMVAATDTADGWAIEPDKENRDQWYAAHTGGARVKLAHNATLFNKPTCYTFLRATDKTPHTRLLVGHYHGASLYELPKGFKGEEVLPARVFIGHGGEVLAVAAADDAKGGWFVTAGSDQTVAAYSLKPWGGQPAVGAEFERFDDNGTTRIRVTAVDVGSPAWEAGLQAGDVLVLLVAKGKRVYDTRPEGSASPATDSEQSTLEWAVRRKGEAAILDPTAAADALAAPAAGQELYFRVRGKDGKTERDALTSVRQRPLWKLFPSFDEGGKVADWVAWVWKGSYYATSTNGDRLVGWHVNAPTAKDAPRFHPLNAFRTRFEKPEVVRQLVENRDLGGVLTAVLGKNPLPPRFGGEPAPVYLAIDRSQVGGEAVKVTVKVDRRGDDVDLLPERVELWVNDYRLPTGWAADPARPFSGVIALPPHLFRDGENTVAVQTYNPRGGRETAFRSLVNTNPPTEPTLLGLAVGVDDYRAHRDASGARGVVGDLKYAVADAAAVAKTFAPYAGPKKFYTDNKLTLRENKDVGRAALLRELDAVRETAKPNDVLVLFLAGHGQKVADGKGGLVVVDKDEGGLKNVRFAFCCPNFHTDQAAEAVVTADELYDKLAAINCRKVVLLDVCHSGLAVETDVVRELVPNGYGPFVMAACRPGQKSYETADLKHGLFTAAVLSATTRRPAEAAAFHLADANDDGRVSCKELFEFVERRVAEARRDQNPTVFPERERLPKMALVSVRRAVDK